MTIGHDDDQQNYNCIIESSVNIDYYIANVVTVSMSIHYFSWLFVGTGTRELRCNDFLCDLLYLTIKRHGRSRAWI